MILLQQSDDLLKKQMTWYRRMEKMGYVINWIEAEIPLEKKLNIIKQKLNENFKNINHLLGSGKTYTLEKNFCY